MRYAVRFAFRGKLLWILGDFAWDSLVLHYDSRGLLLVSSRWDFISVCFYQFDVFLKVVFISHVSGVFRYVESSLYVQCYASNARFQGERTEGRKLPNEAWGEFKVNSIWQVLGLFPKQTQRILISSD